MTEYFFSSFPALIHGIVVGDSCCISQRHLGRAKQLREGCTGVRKCPPAAATTSAASVWLSSACLAQSPLRRRPISHSGDKHVFSSLTTKLVAQVRPPNHRLKTEDMRVFPCLGNSPVHVLRKRVYGWAHCCSDLCCVLLCSPCCEATSVC